MDIVASRPSSPRLSSLVEVSAACRTTDSNTHAVQTRGDVHATAAAGSAATHAVPAYAVTDAGPACGKDLRCLDKADPDREGPAMPACRLSPQ